MRTTVSHIKEEVAKEWFAKNHPKSKFPCWSNIDEPESETINGNDLFTEVVERYADQWEQLYNKASKERADLLKENQELKALCREALTAREQYQFFVNGYANGSASISEANHASTVEHEAYSKLWDYLKSKAQ